MWLNALWGLVGAATNCGVVFLEASRQAKGWPWVEPNGPGGAAYVVSIIIQLFIGTATTAAVATTQIVSSGLIAFGIGISAPIVVKKVAAYVETLLPSSASDRQEQSRGDENGK